MEKRFCENSYQTETSQLVCIAYQTRIWNPGVFGTSTINFFCQISWVAENMRSKWPGGVLLLWKSVLKIAQNLQEYT